MSDKQIYYCVGCGTSHPRRNFYISDNPLHANGTLPYCKEYIKDFVCDDNGYEDIEKFKLILMQMDYPFLYDIYKSTQERRGDTIGNYFRIINSFKSYQGMRWKDSLFEGDAHEQSDDQYYDEINERDFKITPEIVDRWGKSYLNSDTAKEDFMYLEKFYRDMNTTHTIVTPQHKKALILICKLQLKMDKYLENDDITGFSKVHQEYQKLLQTSGLRPIDKKGGAEEAGIRSFSEIFEEIEKDGFIKPAPIEENQDIVDRTIKYIMNYTKRLLNIQTLTEPPVDTPKVDDKDE